MNVQKHISFGRHGDKIEVIVRDSSFVKIYQKEVSTTNKRELENMLKDLKDKGVDIIGLILKKSSSGWFD